MTYYAVYDIGCDSRSRFERQLNVYKGLGWKLVAMAPVWGNGRATLEMSTVWEIESDSDAASAPYFKAALWGNSSTPDHGV